MTISYLFSGFEDKASYSIEVTGVTANGTQITTGRVNFTTSYTTPDTFSFLFLSNNCQGGYITIESNIIGIDGDTGDMEPIFIDGKEIDLRKDGAYVQWVKGYTVDGDWTMRLWGREFKSGKEIFRFSDVDGNAVIVYYKVDSTMCWFEMRAVHNGDLWGYTCESQHIDKPDVSGEVVFRRTSVLVDYLNMFYSFADTLKINNSEFALRDITVFDTKGNKATGNILATHDYFKCLVNYDS